MRKYTCFYEIINAKKVESFTYYSNETGDSLML